MAGRHAARRSPRDDEQRAARFDKPVVDGEQINAPGLTAVFRRHPKRARTAATGTLAGGIVLFILASLAGSAGADPAKPQAAPVPVAAGPQIAPLDVYSAPVEAAGGVVKARVKARVKTVVKTKPVHAKKPAPATKAVISGLAANGIPNVALNAYRVAAARMAHVDPSCGIDWALLAGIGREESDHGRFAGAVLHPDGISTPPIIGIPLNGHGTALIRDTDGGRVDGDTVYDRAVGPMQFIPSTWAAYGTDANGDGMADVFNINDAALTAARYLCTAGGNLRTHAGQVAAVLAYNHSDQYLAQVLALAAAYRTGIPVKGLPVGNISGALPPLRSGGYVPPANPGTPTANSPAAHRTAKKAPARRPATRTAPRSTKTNGSTSGTTGGPPGGPGATSAAASGGTGTGTPGGASTSTPPPTSIPPATLPTPVPTPTTTCLVPDPLDPGHCAVYGP